MLKPEAAAREAIDSALEAAGWVVQDYKALNLSAGRGVAVREFPLKGGYGFADYLLFVDGNAVGVVEAKKEGETLTGVEVQAEKYSVGLRDDVPTIVRPLPFLYETTGAETHFTNGLEPKPRSRSIFAFHKPAALADWLDLSANDPSKGVAETAGTYVSTFRSRLQDMPPLDERGLWSAQSRAIRGLEKSLADNRPRALIQMATGSGKTRMAIAAAYRLVKFAGARRVLFLVDRANLGRQAQIEFEGYRPPDDGRTFAELYNVQLLRSNTIDPASRVVITTVQRLYSILQGEEELPPEAEEGSLFDSPDTLRKEPVPVAYNPAFPVETFDLIFVDECHRSIYNLWRQVIEYFDAFLVGLTATPSKQTFGYFNQNLVMEYGHEQAVADGVNVDYDVYRIRTEITEKGAKIDAHQWVDKRHRLTRKRRWEQLDDDLTYGANELDRAVVATDQIRTVVRTFRDRVRTEIFPGRTEVPKTLIFAKDDSHAEDIVQVVREEFAEGNDFCQKITYKTRTARLVDLVTLDDGTEVEQVSYRASGIKPEDLLSSFRNSYYPRIVVTVDMIATGTDVKPLEIVMFMRSVRSRTFFEQMRGRGVRVVDPTELLSVTPDARAKTHFVVVDCVGVTEQQLIDAPPLERKPSVPFQKLLDAVAVGSRDPDVYSSLASRLARLDRELDQSERDAIAETAKGVSLGEIVSALVGALDPDAHVEAARQEADLPAGAEPTLRQVAAARTQMLKQAAAPLASNPTLRDQLALVKQQLEQTIDVVTKDRVLEAGQSQAARGRARETVQSFEDFIAQHKDEITALQVLYSRPYRQRLRFQDIKALAEAIKAPPHVWTPDVLWRAYETLDRSKVRGSANHVLTDIVSLVRYALHQEPVLVPFPEQVHERFDRWLVQQENLRGQPFTAEQRRWLELIRDHVAANFAIQPDDFDYAPFTEQGGYGRAFKVFGPELRPLLDQLNEALVA